MRDAEQRRRSTIVAVVALSILMSLAGLLAVIDFYLEISVLTRFAGWALIGVVLIGSIVRLWRWQEFNASDAVSGAERDWPEIGQRLRTSHDYQTDPEQVSPAEPELIRALEAETQLRVDARAMQPLGRPWPIFVLLGCCSLAAILWFSALLTWWDWRVATARLMFLPLDYSNVEMEPLPEHVELGDDLVVDVHVEGRPVDSARVLFRSAGESEWKEVSLKAAHSDKLVDDLSAVVPDCDSDLELRVEAGPFSSGVRPVAVRLPLVLEAWQAKVEPPAYTGLPAADGSPADLRIPEGSALRLAAHYNRTPNEVDVEINPLADSPPSAELADGVAQLALKTSAAPIDLSIQAKAADGMADDSELHIDVVPDRRPELKFVAPENNAEAIPTAELRFTLEAFDDYGLRTVGIRYRVDDGPEQTLWEGAPDDASDAIAQTITLPLEDLNLQYPQALTYYAYALDNREPEAQRITSELRFVDIRPFSREYEFKEGQCSGNCQGECLSLEKLIKQQREILGRTFAVTQRGSADTQGIAAKLARDEQDLREKTEALTAALQAKVGPMPALEFAIRSMADAVGRLQANAVADGQIREEHALAELISARKNLRKILKQSDSQSQMCRNVDQQQMDKLRRPERERKQNEEQQLADLRKQLEQLARQQESFCQSAKACQQQGNSSSSSKSASSQPTREQLVKQQQQAAEETRSIQRKLAEGKFGELAPKRAEQAAKSINQSGQSLARTDADEAAIGEAKQAADQLQQLSDHLGRRHNPDFSEKLAAAGRQAQRLSEQQKQLSQSLNNDNGDASQPDKTPLSEQKRIASRAEELVDLVDQLLAESREQDWQVQRALTEQTSQNPPRQAAAGMNAAVEAAEQDRRQAASQSGRRAAGILERFAAGVRQVQQALGPARLEQLTKAEQQAANLLKDLERARSAAERAMARAGAQQLADSLQPLSRGDAELQQASSKLDNSSARQSGPSGREEDAPPEFASSASRLAEGLRSVDEVLLRRIQEAILSGSLQQADGPVPPQYSQMVDEYYRTLSEDIE